MIVRLNGWRRLWVVLTILYFVVVAAFIWETMPTKAKLDRKYVYDTIESVKESDQYAYEIREAYKGLADLEVVQKIHEKKGGALDKLLYEEIDKRYAEDSKGLLRKQLNALGEGLLAWVVPSICVYLLGEAFAWVYRGFRNR